MPEHLSRERISALLDHPEGLPGGLEHIAACPECAREYEQMSRMRMALSGLTDLEPPAGGWDAIQHSLGPASTTEHAVRPAAVPAWRRRMGWPLQAAAVMALFAAGLMVGQRIAVNSDGSPPPETVATADDGGNEFERTNVAADGSPLTVEPAEAYLRTVADLQHLREGSGESGLRRASPEAVTERITHLDGMIDASRAALRDAPADPVLNNFLFQLVDERDDLAGQLDQTLRMTAAEY